MVTLSRRPHMSLRHYSLSENATPEQCRVAVIDLSNALEGVAQQIKQCAQQTNALVGFDHYDVAGDLDDVCAHMYEGLHQIRQRLGDHKSSLSK